MNLLTPQEQSDTARRLLAQVWSPSGLTVTVLGGITLAFYHGLWWPGLVLSKRDAFRLFLPIKQYMIERLTVDELPQWFPYEALGRPFIGATSTGIFHPFTALYFLLPVPDAYRASTLLACLLASIGTFVLARMLAFSRAGALLAGVAFTLSGYVVSLTENILFMYSICMLPFFCVALETALVESRVWTVAPAAVWATVLLIGDIQTGYYYGFIALLWMGARTTLPSYETGLRLALTGGLAVLLAGVQLGPAWVAFTGSERAHPAAFVEQAMRWSTHPLRLVTIFVSPVFEGSPLTSTLSAFFAAQQPPSEIQGGNWAESLYLGVPVTGLALLGAWHRRDLRMLALLAGAALVLSLGRYGGLYQIFYHVVPLWSAFRYPEKLMGVFSFAAALLAGAGLDSIRAHKGRPIYWLAGGILCASAGLALHTDAAGTLATARFESPAVLTTALTGSAAHALLYGAAVMLGMWFILAAYHRGRLTFALAVSALTAMVTLDLSNANLGAYHTSLAKTATFIPAFVKTLRQQEGMLRPGVFRLVSTAEFETIWPESLQRTLGYHGAVSASRRQALAPEHNAEFHIETTPPFLPLYGGALFVMLGQEPSMAVEARFNVAYYVGRQHYLHDPRISGRLVSALPDFDLALFRNPLPVKPRAYLSVRPERAAAPVDPASLIARPDFRSGEVDVIEASDAALPGPARGGEARIERYAPEEVQVRVVTQQPAALILLDAFDKGWKATLETGVPLAIMRANVLVRAVAVPAGDHVVTFRYETPLLRAGAVASLAGGVLCLGMIVQARRRAHHTRSSVP